MKNYIKLIRPKDWAKNLFLFIPVFFAGQFFNTAALLQLFGGFACFCIVFLFYMFLKNNVDYFKYTDTDVY